jgi:death on curing protein
MKEHVWLDRRGVLLLHAESLSEHGGSSGIRDENLLESALERPRNRFANSPESDIAQLAAAYGFGLARNHPFVDGNKRIAFIATALFLRLNGCRLSTERIDEIRMMLDLAAGRLSEDEFATWIRIHSTSYP